MKALEITVRVRNNRLKERRLKMRMTQSVFSKMAAVSLGNYRELEAMRTSPLRKDGEWREIVLVLARFHCVEPEELFPRMARAVKEPVVVRYMDEDELGALMGDDSDRMTDYPCEQLEMHSGIEHALDTLSHRQSQIMRLRCGLDDGIAHTMEEVGAMLNISRERVRQIEARATRMLRHPMRGGPLREFWKADK